MREPTYFLLVSLANGPLHGYAIAQRARMLSDGRVKLTAGTLYGALDRLVDSGQIEVDSEEKVEGRKRRYYRITETGLHAVTEEAERMRAALAVAESEIGKATGLSPGVVGVVSLTGPMRPMPLIGLVRR